MSSELPPPSDPVPEAACEPIGPGSGTDPGAMRASGPERCWCLAAMNDDVHDHDDEEAEEGTPFLAKTWRFEHLENCPTVAIC